MDRIPIDDVKRNQEKNKNLIYKHLKVNLVTQSHDTPPSTEKGKPFTLVTDAHYNFKWKALSAHEPYACSKVM